MTTEQGMTATKRIVMYAWAGDDDRAESRYVCVVLDSSAVAELWKAKDAFDKAQAAGARRMDVYGSGDVLFLSDCDEAEDDQFHEQPGGLVGDERAVECSDLWLRVDKDDFWWNAVEADSGCEVRSKYVSWRQLVRWQAEIEAAEEAEGAVLPRYDLTGQALA